jgi:hypothetical protein
MLCASDACKLQNRHSSISALQSQVFHPAPRHTSRTSRSPVPNTLTVVKFPACLCMVPGCVPLHLLWCVFLRFFVSMEGLLKDKLNEFMY